MNKTEWSDFWKHLEANARWVEMRQQELWAELNRRCPPGPGKAKKRAALLRTINQENLPIATNVIVGPWKQPSGV